MQVSDRMPSKAVCAAVGTPVQDAYELMRGGRQEARADAARQIMDDTRGQLEHDD